MHVKEAYIAAVAGAVASIAGLLIAGGDVADSAKQVIYLGSFMLACVTMVVLSRRADRKSSRR
jgi:uncharacterized membrane protein YoaK (UPF0700 family)